MPQSVEFKLQSGNRARLAGLRLREVGGLERAAERGVLPGRHQAGRINSCSYNGGFRATSLDLLYRDGWTIRAASATSSTTWSAAP